MCKVVYICVICVPNFRSKIDAYLGCIQVVLCKLYLKFVFILLNHIIKVDAKQYSEKHHLHWVIWIRSNDFIY